MGTEDESIEEEEDEFDPNDPFGINNMYVALVTPAVIMLIDRLIPSRQPQRKNAPDSSMQNSGA